MVPNQTTSTTRDSCTDVFFTVILRTVLTARKSPGGTGEVISKYVPYHTIRCMRYSYYVFIHALKTGRRSIKQPQHDDDEHWMMPTEVVAVSIIDQGQQ